MDFVKWAALLMLPLNALAQPSAPNGLHCGANRQAVQRHADAVLALTGAWLRPQLVAASGAVTTLERVFGANSGGKREASGRLLCVYAAGTGRPHTLRFTVLGGQIRVARISENQRWMK